MGSFSEETSHLLRGVSQGASVLLLVDHHAPTVKGIAQLLLQAGCRQDRDHVEHADGRPTTKAGERGRLSHYTP